MLEQRIKELEISMMYLQKEVTLLTDILMNLKLDENHFHYTFIYPNQQSKDEFNKM
jgi:hypothetical protein